MYNSCSFNDFFPCANPCEVSGPRSVGKHSGGEQDDIFCGDPFKINSYQFHYASRPFMNCFPGQSAKRPYQNRPRPMPYCCILPNGKPFPQCYQNSLCPPQIPSAAMHTQTCCRCKYSNEVGRCWTMQQNQTYPLGHGCSCCGLQKAPSNTQYSSCGVQAEEKVCFPCPDEKEGCHPPVRPQPKCASTFTARQSETNLKEHVKVRFLKDCCTSSGPTCVSEELKVPYTEPIVINLTGFNDKSLNVERVGSNCFNISPCAEKSPEYRFVEDRCLPPPQFCQPDKRSSCQSICKARSTQCICPDKSQRASMSLEFEKRCNRRDSSTSFDCQLKKFKFDLQKRYKKGKEHKIFIFRKSSKDGKNYVKNCEYC